MKKIASALACMLAFSFSVQAANFKEGKDYETLSSGVAFNAPNQIVKVYSTNCPFCYKYEQAVIPDLVENLPEGASYDAYHITTKPPLGIEKACSLAVAKVMSEDLYHKLKMDLYARYHDQHKKFANPEEVYAHSAKILGISVAQLHDSAATPEVKALMAKWDQGVEIAKIQGIPALVVNGKYLIHTKAIKSQEMLSDLVAELLHKQG